MTKLQIFCLIILFWPVSSLAASFRFIPNQVTAPPGEPFTVSVFLDNEKESINAVDGDIIFPAGQLELKTIKDADSIINLWLERPNIQGGQVHFSGVIPGGFLGVLSPYYHDSRPGKLFDLVFVGRKAGEVLVDWQAPRALINDGQGSQAQVVAEKLLVSLQAGVVNSAPLVGKIIDDTDPPESFVPELAHDPNLFDNQWFVSFATRDSGSGIARYEINEQGDWQPAESPYLLRNQNRNRSIRIRAIDNVGNTRVVILPPRSPESPYANYPVWLIIIVLCLAAFFYYSFYSSRRRS